MFHPACRTFKCRGLIALVTFVSCLATVTPTQAYPSGAKAPAAVDKKTAPVTDADLQAMARKLSRAHRPGVLGKGAAAKPSALVGVLNHPVIPGAASTSAIAPKHGGLRIEWASSNGTPVFLEGPGLQSFKPGWGARSTTPGTVAMAYFQAQRDLMRLRNPAAELRLLETTRDRLGSRHEVFQQMHQGIPVWGGRVHAHFDRTGTMYALNARYSPSTVMPAGPGFLLSESQAVDLAKADLLHQGPLQEFNPEMRALLAYSGPVAERNVWVHPSEPRAHWAWRVEIRPNVRDRWRYFIDGSRGTILEKYNATNADGPQTATATDLTGLERTLNTYQVGSTFYLIDATRKGFNAKSSLPNDPKGALWTLDAAQTDLSKVNQVASKNNAWADPAAVSAHDNMGRVFDYYLKTFGRAGIDGMGGTMISAVHVTEKGRPMDNAYWNGKVMAYGDGDQGFLPLARGLDVAAHEMTHGVIDATVNLEYKFQSGALNESLADVFAAMVDRDDWTLGEDVVKTSFFKSGAMRDMENPNNGASGPSQTGWQPAHMNEFAKLPLEEDNGGVHINSGIPNRACYLIAKAIGREKTEAVYYRVLEAKYLNPGSQFIDMRLGAIRAATDLYGENSPEVAAVKQGFAAVGIGSAETPGQPTARPPDAAPVAGAEYVAMVNADAGDNSIYVAKPVVKGDTDIVQLTPTQVFTQTGNPLAITDDGSVLLFIDAEHALRGIDELGEQVVSDAGVWKSIAVSPDGSKVAATTLEPDAKIYILDLAHPEDSKTVPLYNPTTGFAVKANNVVFADALDFNSTGDFLLYDALNRVSQAEGDPIEYYDANLLDIKRGVITPFLPARPDGISIGNPSFAQTSDLHLVFDLYDESTSKWRIVTADLFTGDFRVIDSGGVAAGFPRYSTRDDRIVYERTEGERVQLQQVALAQDKYTPAGTPQAYVSNAQKPLWFAIGKRPTGIRLPGAARPGQYALRAPREGGLLLELPRAADLVVSAYTVSGRKLGDVFRGRRSAGVHRLEWPSAQHPGVYVLRLEARPDGGAKVSLARKIVWTSPARAAAPR